MAKKEKELDETRESKEMKEMRDVLDRFREFAPGRGHVSYLCASRIVPDAWIAVGWPAGFRKQRVTQKRPTWIISGRDRTSTEGVATIDIGEYLDVPECAPAATQGHWGPAVIDGKPTFLATPLADEPVVLSASIVAAVREEQLILLDILDGRAVEGGEKEYQITAKVRAWRLDGAPAAVEFSWLCIAEAAVRYKVV